jgi:hypothetical protein
MKKTKKALIILTVLAMLWVSRTSITGAIAGAKPTVGAAAQASQGPSGK